VQYDRISYRELVGVQNNLVCILDEGVERNAPTFVLENLAAVIAGGFGRVLLDVMPCAGTAVHHKSPPSPSPRFLTVRTTRRVHSSNGAQDYDAKADEAPDRGFTLFPKKSSGRFTMYRLRTLAI
jgi:hypothetical protein